MSPAGDVNLRALYDQQHPRVPFSNLSTSLEAAHEVQHTLGTKRARVLEALEVGRTAHEVCEATGLGIQTVTARIRGLVLEGAVVDSGATRPSRPGSRLRAKVWVLNRAGRPAPVPAPQSVGRVAAAVSAEREKWRVRVAYGLSALEGIEVLAEIGECLATQPLLVQAKLREIKSRASHALAQMKAEPEPTAVGLAPRRNAEGATEC